jgi:hypothetical protein
MLTDEDLVAANKECKRDEQLSTAVTKNEFTEKVTEDFDSSASLSL